MAARLREHYQKKVVPALTKEFGYKNAMAVPKIEKISINIGMGEATQNAKLMDGAVNELAQIAGQKPVITKAPSRSRVQAARRPCRSAAW
jgi:large subunit ribosomal protein L5